MWGGSSDPAPRRKMGRKNKKTAFKMVAVFKKVHVKANKVGSVRLFTSLYEATVINVPSANKTGKAAAIKAYKPRRQLFNNSYFYLSKRAGRRL